jgi:Phosphotransferase enzyme family
MSIVSNLADTTEFRVALLDPSSWMLVTVRDSDGIHLPRVRIPKWTRPAEEINDAVREKWQLVSLVLTVLNGKNAQPACAIAEVMSPHSANLPCDLELHGIESIDTRDLDEDERAWLCDVVSGPPAVCGPFSRLGWLKEAQTWVKSDVTGAEFNGDFRQYNASGTFALLRLSTKSGQSYWLKATGEPNRHEFSITIELEKLFPNYLPTLVAMREDWNAWVTEDAGATVGDAHDPEILTAAVEALADLQLLSLDHISRLEAAGCMNRRLSAVQAHMTEVFAYLEESMGHQTSKKVMPVTSSRLGEIRFIVEDACERMQELCIPDCLVNGDINLNNILFDGQRFRFTDWAEGAIGNPFFTLQQVVQHITRDGEHLEWAPRLCGAYKKKWLGVLTERQIECAFVLMPLLTMVDYLYARGDWLYSSRRDDPSFQGFARTLGRCMDRAAAELCSAEVQRA